MTLGAYHRARDDLSEAKKLEKLCVHQPLLPALRSLQRIVNYKITHMPLHALFVTRTMTTALDAT